jgi:hypothetical protein
MQRNNRGNDDDDDDDDDDRRDPAEHTMHRALGARKRAL